MSSAKISITRKRVTLEIKRGSTRGFEITRAAPRKIIVQRHAFGGGAARASADQVDVIDPVADGQIVFALSTMPANAQLVRMIVNGTRYRPPAFLVNGQTATWNHQFTITSSDEIEFTYPI